MPNITWKEVVNGGDQIVKLDDRTGSMPAEGDEKEINGRRYKVVGLGNAEVLLEALEPPPADPANPAIGKDGKPVESQAVIDTRRAAEHDNATGKRPAVPRRDADVHLPDEDDAHVQRAAASEKLPVKAASASRFTDTKPAPKHVPQRRYSDPLARHKVASHKKK